MENKSILVKKISLGLSGFFAALIFSALYHNFVTDPGLGTMIIAFVGAAFFLSIFLIQCFLGGGAWVSPAFIVLNVLGMSALFLGNLSVILLTGMIAAVAMLEIAYYNTQTELKESMEIRFWKTSRIVMGLGTMAVAIFASMAYFSMFKLDDPAAAQKTLEVLVRPVEPLVSGYIPNFSVNSSVNAIAEALVPSELKLAPENQKREFIAQAAAKLSDAFAGFARVKVAIGDSVIDILYKATIGKLAQQSPSYQNLILIAVAIVFFFFIKFLLFLIDWLAVLLGYAFYHLLLSFRFFRIELQNVPKRTIVLE